MSPIDALKLSPTARAALDRLDAAQRRELDLLLADAQRTQETELRRASDAALSHVPALLRAPVRRILGS